MNSNITRNTRQSFNNLSTIMRVLVIVVAVIILLMIGWFIYSLITDYNMLRADEPYLVKGTKLGRNALTVPGSKVPLSVDGQYGLEFTYSMWIYINDWTYRAGSWKHILHKGNDTAMPLQAPGIWLYPDENKLAINMNTFHSVKESCDIGNIPVNKWFHLTVTVVGHFVDVYVNGRLKRRCEYQGVPKQNYGDVYINQFGGFDGFLSNVRYFNSALPIWRIEQIVREGPDSDACIDDNLTKPPYLANDWWSTNMFSNDTSLNLPNTNGGLNGSNTPNAVNTISINCPTTNNNPTNINN